MPYSLSLNVIQLCVNWQKMLNNATFYIFVFLIAYYRKGLADLPADFKRGTCALRGD